MPDPTSPRPQDAPEHGLHIPDGAPVEGTRPITGHPPMVPCHGVLEPDPGCPECGACIQHDGCADKQHPLQEGDCESCGACRVCIEQCERSGCEGDREQ